MGRSAFLRIIGLACSYCHWLVQVGWATKAAMLTRNLWLVVQ
jgi:hypothetical protein